MKLVMVSNFMNHHQLELCNQLYALCEEFLFLCTAEMPPETRAFGYDDLSVLPYVIEKPQTEAAKAAFIARILEADAVIFGACSNQYVRMRISQNKLTFLFSERMWKKGTYRRFIPMIRKKVTDRFVNRPNVYILGASCYLAYDLSLVGFPTEQCYTWGYFPPFETLCIADVLAQKHETSHIVWAGRFIPLKHCQDVLKALGRVRRAGFSFMFDLVGDGPCRSEYEQLIQNEGLEDCVTFWGSLPQQQVRQVMKKARIFIFSSDFNEGWGAVVNEAMNSLCAPIVSHAVGSGGFLIRDTQNGLLYRSRDIKNLADKITVLLRNPSMCSQMAQQAYKTLQTDFNGTEAAQRLVHFSQCALEGKALPQYESGPLSPSPVIRNNWYKG